MRSATGTVAAEVGLEQARHALLRNLPGDALAALDGVWERARRSEEGWYLRSGALTVLGLPGETERVADAGLSLHPTSAALRFVQSIARFAMGDVSGARGALQPALERAPHQPVLLVQMALIVAKQGDVPRARTMLAQLEQPLAGHPALKWGRDALTLIVADAARSNARGTPSSVTAHSAPPLVTTPIGATPHVSPPRSTPRGTTAIEGTPQREVASTAVTSDNALIPFDWPRTTPSGTPVVDSEMLASTSAKLGTATPDVAASALERLGAKLTSGTPIDIARDVRMLLRAFSAGGTLAAATTPEQSHAARIVLTAILSAVTREPSDVPGTVRTMAELVVPLLQHGRADEAAATLRRQTVFAREPIGRLLASVVRGAAPEPLSEPASRLTTPSSIDVFPMASTDEGSATVRGEIERGPIVPIRIGLGLLEETAAQRAADSTLTKAIDAESSLTGWGAAHAAAESQTPDWYAGGTSVRVAAMICVAIAAGAFVTGHGAIAIGLGLGAAWLGVRRSGHAPGATSDAAPGEADGPHR